MTLNATPDNEAGTANARTRAAETLPQKRGRRTPLPTQAADPAAAQQGPPADADEIPNGPQKA
ncbi:MAG: hypothetical protein KDB20_02000, partial [Microthrixaceae bacterium]|nr:hypothetical protein [Microthrixaceae bacterium]